MGKEGYSLHFYPDDERLDVKNRAGTVVKSYPARTVDMNEVRKGTPRYEEPPKGTFIVQVIQPITTKNWAYSRIAWGEMVEIRTSDMAVFHKGKKILNLDEQSYPLETIIESYNDMPEVVQAIRKGKTIRVPYRFNDFGSMGIKFFKDINGNKRFDPQIEHIVPTYIHSTPGDEWDRINNQDKARALGYSHGCIHMYPSDIDEILANYVVRRVTTVTIH